jgi:hypothetical protein
VGPDAWVTVSVSRELLAVMTEEWSPAVQVRIDPINDPAAAATHTMTCRTPVPDPPQGAAAAIAFVEGISGVKLDAWQRWMLADLIEAS